MADEAEVEKSFWLSRPDGWVINRKTKKIILLEFKRTSDAVESYFQVMWKVPEKQHTPILTCLRTLSKERGWEVEVVPLVAGQRSVREKEWLEALRIFGIGKEDGQRKEEIQEFYAWLDEGSNAMAEAGARERNNDSAGVTEVEVIVEAGGHEINAGAASVTANSGNTSKTKETGQKRKRYYFSAVQTTFLEAQLKDNKLQTPEDRRKVADVFTKETKETFDVEKIHTWFRNHKNKKNKGGGEEGEGGS